jgi:hypothetical protein
MRCSSATGPGPSNRGSGEQSSSWSPRRSVNVVTRSREERIAGELRQNYLTWLGLALLLLLAGVFATAVVTSRYGLWADILLALLSGALGGALSGVVRLRSPEKRLGTLRNLWLVMLVQPLLGSVGA